MKKLLTFFVVFFSYLVFIKSDIFAKTLSISGPSILEIPYSDTMDAYYDKVEVEWNLIKKEESDQIPENASFVFIESKDGGVSQVDPAGIINYNNGFPNPLNTIIWGVGCRKLKAYIATPQGNQKIPWTDISNEIEICAKSADKKEYIFPDVMEGETFTEYIENLAKDEIINGYSNGFFKPNYPVKRGAMAKFVRKGLGFEQNIDCDSFPDVGQDNVFFEDIQTLKCEDVISGYNDGEFKSENLVTRGQAMKFLIEGARAIMQDHDFLKSESELSFPDVPESHTFYENIMAAYANGIVSGYSTGEFKPDNPITRGAMSKMVDNTRGKLVNNLDTQLAESRNSQRYQDVNTILNAVYQWFLDNNGNIPDSITKETTEICATDSSDCTGLVDLKDLTKSGEYLVAIPEDPYAEGNGTGYTISIDSINRVTVSAPNAELGELISATR